MENDRSEDQTVLSANEARAGRPVKGMRLVLGVSVAGAIVVLGIVWLMFAR